jgi:ribosome maturation factor RimP
MKVTEIVAKLAEPVVKAHGCELWDVEYVREGDQRFLRLYLDKETGVDINDCEAISRAVDPLLDEADPIDKSYYLEVCSPGLERELTRDEHFVQMQGEKIKPKLYKARDGVKEFGGLLISGDKEKITVRINEEDTEFLRSEISFCKLDDIDF